LSGYLQQIYGRDSFALLVDEGCEFAWHIYPKNGLITSLSDSYNVKDGVALASPATAEKGYLDVHVEVNTPGGHSSVPPDHTVSWHRLAV
jgi:Gly-Xaa carboxypeptidase